MSIYRINFLLSTSVGRALLALLFFPACIFTWIAFSHFFNFAGMVPWSFYLPLLLVIVCSGITLDICKEDSRIFTRLSFWRIPLIIKSSLVLSEDLCISSIETKLKGEEELFYGTNSLGIKIKGDVDKTVLLANLQLNFNFNFKV